MRTKLLGILVCSLVLGTACGCAPHTAHGAAPSSSPAPSHPGASSSAAVAARWDAAAGTITIGAGPHAVDVYLDARCPYCAEFDTAQGAELQRLVNDGSIHYILHPLVFLDRASKGTAYSTRAASILVSAAQQRPAAVLDVLQDLFDHQPEEDVEGPSDNDLIALAARHGVDAASAIADPTIAKSLKRATAKVFSGHASIAGTPTVRVDGKDLTDDLYDDGFVTALRHQLAD